MPINPTVYLFEFAYCFLPLWVCILFFTSLSLRIVFYLFEFAYCFLPLWVCILFFTSLSLHIVSYLFEFACCFFTSFEFAYCFLPLWVCVLFLTSLNLRIVSVWSSNILVLIFSPSVSLCNKKYMLKFKLLKSSSNHISSKVQLSSYHPT